MLTDAQREAALTRMKAAINEIPNPWDESGMARAALDTLTEEFVVLHKDDVTKRKSRVWRCSPVRGSVRRAEDRPTRRKRTLMPRDECAIFPRGYLPMDCPKCGRRRLEYGVNEEGDVIYVECEKCGANSDGTRWEPITNPKEDA